MKKLITTVFLVSAFSGLVNAQATSIVKAPLSNGASTQLRAPNGNTSMASLKGCFIIPASELSGLALTNSVITQFGFDLISGVSPASTGAFTLYLQNTTDATYLKGTSFATALTGMTNHYAGNFVIPAATNTNITLTLATNFNYTGGGIYVAYQYTAAAAALSANFAATYDANNALTIGGATSSASTTPAPDAIANTAFRPVFRFSAANTASNEIAVERLFADGTIAKLANATQVVSAQIRNSSNIQKSNIAVALGVTGANTFADTKTISALAAGASTIISFNAFPSTTSGLNNMTVSTLPDQNNTNNAATWAQSVTCNNVAIPPPVAAGAFTSSAYGAGSNAAGVIYAFNYTSSANASSLTSVSCVIPSFANAANSGKQLYPVLCDASGMVLASGNTLTIGATDMDVYKTLTFQVPPSLTPSTPYYFGIAIPTNQYFPIGNAATNGVVAGFVQIPIAGGTPTVFTAGGYLSLGASLGFSATAITASATKTRVCKGESTTINAVGPAGMTYTWNTATNPNIGTTASLAVTPTVSGTSGVVNYTVNGTDGASGCKATSAVVTISVAACTSIADNTGFGTTVKVFPAPANNGQLTISGLAGSTYITLSNILGQVVSQTLSDKMEETLDVSKLSSGQYMVTVSDGANQSRSFKVLIQN